MAQVAFVLGWKDIIGLTDKIAYQYQISLKYYINIKFTEFDNCSVVCASISI